ncbi:MAG: hypothetical protein AB1778_04885 [Candidatus Bipolaricaulota bacterium]
MRKTRMWILAVSVVVVALSAWAAVASGSEASVRTNAGTVATGTLQGLASTLRLVDVSPLVGPAMQYDIPLDAIQQLWVEFPRIVIETAEYILVGPFSAFTGLDELLRVEGRGSIAEIPLLAVDTIAFGGRGFNPLPRHWLGDRWLNHPLFVLRKAASGIGDAAPTAVIASPIASAETPAGETIIWNSLEPAIAEEPEAAALPAWVGLLAIAALLAIIFLVPRGS